MRRPRGLGLASRQRGLVRASRRLAGFSLSEALVGLAVVAVLGTMVAQLFRAGASLQARGQEGGRTAEALAVGLHAILREIPEASPIYTLNGALYVPPGGVPCEAVLVPGAGEESALLELIELDPARVGPLELDRFVATDPSFYRVVAWSAAGDALMREVRPFDPLTGGFSGREAPRAVTRVPGYFLTLHTEALGGSQYRVSLRATPEQEGEPEREVVAHGHLRPR